MFNISDLKYFLSNNKITIEYTKNGERNRVKGTLKEEFVPLSESKEMQQAKGSKNDIISVWDVENSYWHYFKLDNIKSIELT